MPFTWTTLSPVPDDRYFSEGSLVGVGGTLYATNYYTNNSNPMLAYDIATNAWTTLSIDYSGLPGSMLRDPAGVAVDTTIWYYNGGGSQGLVPFDTTTLSFGTFIPLPSSGPGSTFGSYYHTSMVKVNDVFYVYGSGDTGAVLLTFNVGALSFGLTSCNDGHYTNYRSICTDGTRIFGVEGYHGTWDTTGIQPSGQYDTGVLETYTIATDVWTYSSHTDPNYRNDDLSVYSDGKVYAIGGGTDDGNFPGGYCVPWISSYDVVNDSWTIESDLDIPRCEPLVCLFNDHLYILGGDYNSSDTPPVALSLPFISTPMSSSISPTFSLPFYDPFTRDDADVLGDPWTGNLGIRDHQAAWGTGPGDSSPSGYTSSADIGWDTVTTPDPAGEWNGGYTVAPQLLRDMPANSYYEVRQRPVNKVTGVRGAWTQEYANFGPFSLWSFPYPHSFLGYYQGGSPFGTDEVLGDVEVRYATASSATGDGALLATWHHGVVPSLPHMSYVDFNEPDVIASVIL